MSLIFPSSPVEDDIYEFLGKKWQFDGVGWRVKTDPVAFADIADKPTTLAGYGITDAFSGAYADLSGKPDLFSGAYGDLSGTPTLFSGNYADLSGKPTLFSGAYGDLTGRPTLGTAAAAATGDFATAAQGSKADSAVQPAALAAAIADLIDGAPGAIDTLNELAAAIGDDPNFSTTIMAAIAAKADSGHSHAYSDLTGRPALFSGVYGDLTGKPTLFSGAYGDLSGLPTLFSGSYTDLSGKPTLGTAAAESATAFATAAQGLKADSAVQPATMASAIAAAIADVIDGAPGAIDTLNELAAALGDDPNFAATVTAAIAGKAALVHGHSYYDLSDLPALFSGNYADLSGKPSLFSGAYADLSGKPVLFSGVYADLSGKPALFSGAYGDLSGQPDLSVYAVKDDAVLTGATTVQGVRVDVVAHGMKSSGTENFSAEDSAVHTITNGGAHSWTFTGWGSEYSEIHIICTNAGAAAITLPTINWLAGDGSSSTTFSSMDVTLQASGKNHFVIWTEDGGTTLYGKAA